MPELAEQRFQYREGFLERWQSDGYAALNDEDKAFARAQFNNAFSQTLRPTEHGNYSFCLQNIFVNGECLAYNIAYGTPILEGGIDRLGAHAIEEHMMCQLYADVLTGDKVIEVANVADKIDVAALQKRRIEFEALDEIVLPPPPTAPAEPTDIITFMPVVEPDPNAVRPPDTFLGMEWLYNLLAAIGFVKRPPTVQSLCDPINAKSDETVARENQNAANAAKRELAIMEQLGRTFDEATAFEELRQEQATRRDEIQRDILNTDAGLLQKQKGDLEAFFGGRPSDDFDAAQGSLGLKTLGREDSRVSFARMYMLTKGFSADEIFSQSPEMMDEKRIAGKEFMDIMFAEDKKESKRKIGEMSKIAMEKFTDPDFYPQFDVTSDRELANNYERVCATVQLTKNLEQVVLYDTSQYTKDAQRANPDAFDAYSLTTGAFEKAYVCVLSRKANYIKSDHYSKAYDTMEISNTVRNKISSNSHSVSSELHHYANEVGHAIKEKFGNNIADTQMIKFLNSADYKESVLCDKFNAMDGHQKEKTMALIAAGKRTYEPTPTPEAEPARVKVSENELNPGKEPQKSVEPPTANAQKPAPAPTKAGKGL